MKTKPKPKPLTLLHYWDRLTPKDQAVICGILRLQCPQYANVHRGLLPFVDAEIAACHLITAKLHTNSTDHQRVYATILAKIAAAPVEPHILILNPIKVARHFGKHPERGRPLPVLGKKRVTAGLKWSLPHRDYVPDTDVLVPPCVSLKRQGHYWEVHCDPKHHYAVEAWLLEHCT